jgi:hypothetical protein
VNDPWAGPPTTQDQIICPCQGECEGENEATCHVVIGHDWRHGKCTERTKPMCHSCAVKERAEKDAGHSS